MVTALMEDALANMKVAVAMWTAGLDMIETACNIHERLQKEEAGV